jgi:transmembrane sensor
MMLSSGERSRAEKRKVRAEAAAWLARLHGPDRGPTLEAGLRRWLAEHPLHAREFELATDLWDESGGGHAGETRARGLRRERSSALRRVALPIAGSLAAAMLLAAWFIRP